VDTITERQAAIATRLIGGYVPWTSVSGITGQESAVRLGTYPLAASTDDAGGDTNDLLYAAYLRPRAGIGVVVR
jgi:hypothetical protein